MYHAECETNGARSALTALTQVADSSQEMRNVCFVAQNLQSPMQSRQASMAGGFISTENSKPLEPFYITTVLEMRIKHVGDRCQQQSNLK
ncbi:hypothetical protein V6N13_115925 [Hibiscus sabdariffa]